MRKKIYRVADGAYFVESYSVQTVEPIGGFGAVLSVQQPEVEDTEVEVGITLEPESDEDDRSTQPS